MFEKVKLFVASNKASIIHKGTMVAGAILGIVVAGVVKAMATKPDEYETSSLEDDDVVWTAKEYEDAEKRGIIG